MLLGWNIEDNDVGNNLILKRNINMAIWRKLISSTFKHFSLTNSGGSMVTITSSGAYAYSFLLQQKNIISHTLGCCPQNITIRDVW